MKVSSALLFVFSLFNSPTDDPDLRKDLAAVCCRLSCTVQVLLTRARLGSLLLHLIAFLLFPLKIGFSRTPDTRLIRKSP